MNLTDREKKMIRKLNRPSHQFGFHLAAALVMLLAGVLTAVQAYQDFNHSDLWLGCLVATIALFWTERLITSRMHQRLIAKLIRIRVDWEEPPRE